MPVGSVVFCRAVGLLLLGASAIGVDATRTVLHAQSPSAPSAVRPEPAQRGNAALRIGSVVSPDTVQVGDPFILTVTVEVPAGARVTWPTPADSNGPVSLRAPVRVTGNENGAVRRETAEYDLAVWAIGAVKVVLPDIKVNEQSRETVVPFESPTIFVQSVLPADTSLHQPKPAKDLFPRVIPWWEKWWPVLVVLAVLLLIGLLAMRARRKKLVNHPLDPFVRAERDFQRLDRLALHEAGEQGRFVALALEVLRTYMSVRIPAASLALTSDELLLAVASDSRVPTQRLAPLLSEGDTIKFGRYFVDGAHARELAVEARGVVSAIEQADQARRAAEKAKEKEQQRAKRKEDVDARTIAEEKARLESRRGKSEAA
ncbi:MAG: hypothetical protein H7Z40_08375 [Phycisphaerae bacterium]|nr:hypothetical protein [Gemmatimonadaceae bacterium]